MDQPDGGSKGGLAQVGAEPRGGGGGEGGASNVWGHNDIDAWL